MLRHLTIRHFVIVDHLELAFDSGFTALTGETGAGKSIMIDALSLALGMRADGDWVRSGEKRAEITAEFELADGATARQWLEDAALADDEPSRLVLRRILETGGKSRCFINGTAVTLGQVRELVALLVDIHGQHEHQNLLRRDAQLALLDDFAGHGERLRELAQRYRQWVEVAKQREALEANAEAVARERAELQNDIGELERLAFSEARWDDTLAEQRRLAHAAALIASAESALQVLDESEDAVLERIEAIAADLREALENDAALNEAQALVESAQVELREAVLQLRQYRRRVELDPARLATVDREIGAVQEVARKFRVEPRQLPVLLDQKRQRLQTLGGGQSFERLKARESEAESAYQSAAEALSASRRAAATTFSAEVTRHIHQLAMQGGRFAINWQTRPASESGLETCEFQVAAHQGQPLGNLARVASGGELSRVSLAIQMMASERGGVATMIFDEVDAGIGGRVAEVVGRLLAALGERHQVLAVTHLPQVAACAAHQFQVGKTAVDGVVVTEITPLHAKARVEEIARMLGGISITEATRKAAKEMLEASRNR